MSKPEPIDTYYYVDDYTDEVLPCDARLDAWAEWLSKPDDDWNHQVPADGEVFAVSTLVILANIEVVSTADGIVVPLLPVGTSQVFARYDDENSGWDPDASTAFTLKLSEEGKADEIRKLVTGYQLADIGDSVWIACVADGPNYMATFIAGPPPSLTLGATVQ